MKRYVPIVIGIVALCAVLYVGNNQILKDHGNENTGATSPTLNKVTGKVTRMFEGENVLEYSFDIPETATTTVEKDGSLIKVTDEGKSVLAMYTSFEGGRGYSPEDYINQVIVPKVKAVTVGNVTTIGALNWSTVESEWSEWYVAKSTDGNWLLVVENKKVDSEKATTIIQSIVTK